MRFTMPMMNLTIPKERVLERRREDKKAVNFRTVPMLLLLPDIYCRGGYADEIL